MTDATPIFVPDAGSESITFGQWLVGEGEAVTEGDRVAELLIPGTSIDVSAPRTGILHHRAGRGDTLQIDDEIGSIR